MAKAMTKSQLVAKVAEKAAITKKAAAELMDFIAQVAYKEAKNTFTLPGLGKLVLVQRKARMGRNPATGETIKIKAKKVVKFRVAKAAKDAILGAKQASPLLSVIPSPFLTEWAFFFSGEKELHDFPQFSFKPRFRSRKRELILSPSSLL
jgi:DNA-binding protein HU-beta